MERFVPVLGMLVMLLIAWALFSTAGAFNRSTQAPVVE